MKIVTSTSKMVYRNVKKPTRYFEFPSIRVSNYSKIKKSIPSLKNIVNDNILILL